MDEKICYGLLETYKGYASRSKESPVPSKMEPQNLSRQLLLMDVFPSFLIEKVKKHHIGYQYVNAGDEEAVSPKGWADDELALR